MIFLFCFMFRMGDKYEWKMDPLLSTFVIIIMVVRYLNISSIMLTINQLKSDLSFKFSDDSPLIPALILANWLTVMAIQRINIIQGVQQKMEQFEIGDILIYDDCKGAVDEFLKTQQQIWVCQPILNIYVSCKMALYLGHRVYYLESSE